MLSFINEMKDAVNKEFNVRIGTLPVKLEHNGIRSNSMAIGNFACDLVKDSYGNVDMVIINSGNLRSELKSGDITLGNIQNEFAPFNNEVAIVSLNGKDLLNIIRLSGEKRGKGGFLQFSRGVEVKYTSDGNFIYAKLNGKDISESEYYNIALSDFILDGGDGYIDYENNPIGRKGKNIVMTGNDIRDSLISKIKELDNISIDYIDENPRVIFE